MKGILAICLWTLAGMGVGNAFEQVTGLALTVPMEAAFIAIGLYLAVRIMRIHRTVSAPRRVDTSGEPLAA